MFGFDVVVLFLMVEVLDDLWVIENKNDFCLKIIVNL